MPERAAASYDPVEIYRRRAAEFGTQAAAEARRSRRLAHLRLVLFLAAAVAIAAAIGAQPGLARTAIAVLGAALATAFVAAATAHARVRRRESRFAALREVNEEGPYRVHREWNAIPERDALDADPEHAYARDLDVGGHASLFRLLGPVGTAAGVQRLREWLLGAAPPEVIMARQPAIAELAELHELRDALAAQRLLHRRTTAAEVERFIEWAESPPAVTGVLPVVLALLLPPLALGALLLRFSGVVTGMVWLFPLAANLVVLALLGTRLRDTIERASARAGGGPLHHAVSAFELLGEARLEAPLLRELRLQLEGDGHHALREARALERITHLAEVRYSPMLHFALQLLTLWDLQIVVRLDRWRRRAGTQARDWLWALGDIEALAALATLRHDNPEWTFPELAAGEAQLAARALGHPLIPLTSRVGNDVTLGPPGTFLLVTGSNMSGKSTLLRAIGLNAVLAQAGAPVCATSMRLTPIRVHTSMRIQDSLEQGVSFFMAELLRLRAVVDAARVGLEPGMPPLLYLLDEILQGTNTAERQVAARRIIRELLSLPAIGAVTSHDLSLADSEELRRASAPVHFTETVLREDGVPRMTFDYRLRPGLASSVNALTLMEMIGLAPFGEG